MNFSKNIFLSIVTLSVMATFCACSDLENTAPEMMVDIYKTQSGKAYAMGGVGSQKFIDSVDAQESYNRLVQSFLENGFVDSCMSCEPSPADNPDLDPLYYFSFVSMKEESGVVHLPVEMISYASLKEFRCSLKFELEKKQPELYKLGAVATADGVVFYKSLYTYDFDDEMEFKADCILENGSYSESAVGWVDLDDGTFRANAVCKVFAKMDVYYDPYWKKWVSKLIDHCKTEEEVL
ncbi:hypothetical protein [Fibrobacter sp. UWB3]|uniref:hypothetical protein n=1 Tax=Fibrobacter sp. UWB3 TaxID=1964357 RepID=UPI000B52688C|nr:hypothetical protein [Fibrobacter sp. UWB3]OWV19017.1 hypothetical protein B7991_09065 [Fibrobacter sp. UWB3]